MMGPDFDSEGLEEALELFQFSKRCIKDYPFDDQDRAYAQHACLLACEALQEELHPALDRCGDDELIAVAKLLLSAKRK